MLSRREWLLFVLLPGAAVLLLDLATKTLAMGLDGVTELGWLQLVYFRNTGFMLGSMSDVSKLYTVVMPATLGAFLLFAFLVLQYFLPIRSLALRAGTSILLGGVLGNFLDRMTYGAVRDFLVLATPFGATGIFNVADALQWVGVALIVRGYVASGSLLYPVNERRGRKWINPKFQRRYVLTLLFAGGAFALIAGVLSTTFLNVTLSESTRLTPVERRELWLSFAAVYGGATLIFLTGLAAFGILMSHRIAGPILGFENFLDDILKGKARQFNLRRGDEFRQFEDLATRFQDLVHSRLGLDAAPLEAGMRAPVFAAQTRDGRELRIEDYAGRKIWLIFYRYAMCPLCAIHLDEAKETMLRALAAGMQVLLVYESSPEEFASTSNGATAELLRSLDIPMIADPTRALYTRYRARTSLSALLRPSTVLLWARAWSRRFKQGPIQGNAGQLPAHFIIDEAGQVELAHYGTHFNDHLALATVDTYIQEAAAKRAG